MRKKGALCVAAILTLLMLAADSASSSEYYNIHTWTLGDVSYEIRLPEGWEVSGDNSNNSFCEILFGSEDKVMGGIMLQDQISNHREILWEDELEVQLGKGAVFILRGASAAAEKVYEEWYEVAALINREKTASSYYIYLNSDVGSIQEDIQRLKAVAGSLKIK
jgi:hypothetical protein